MPIRPPHVDNDTSSGSTSSLSSREGTSRPQEVETSDAQSQNSIRGILQFFMYHCIAFVCAAESAFGDLPFRAWHIRCNSVFVAAENTCRTLCITRSRSV